MPYHQESKNTTENWKLPLRVVLASSKQLFITYKTIPDVLLHLIRNLFKQTELWNETEENFYSVQKFLESLLKIHTFDPIAKKSVNKLLHTSLDILADFERVSGSECSDTTHKFCEACASLVEKTTAGRKSWLEIDVFYWANLLCYREGYSHDTKQFVDGSLKNLFLRQLTETSGFSIPHYCLELPKIVQNLKSQGYNIESFSNLQTAFDEALVHSLLKLIDDNSITETKGIADIEKFVLQVDKRPLAMEAFSKVVLEKFPVVTSNTATVEAALKILEFPPRSIILELIRRENKTTISQFSSLLPRISAVFLSVSSLLREGGLTPVQFQLIAKKESTFAEICGKLKIADQKQILEAFSKNSIILRKVESKISETEKLLILIHKFQSIGVVIDVGSMEDFARRWHNEPMNILADCRVEPLNFKFFGESIVAKDLGLIQKFNDFLKSQLFSKIAERALKASFQNSKLTSFTYTDVLRKYLPQAEEIYLQQADTVISGRLNFGDAQKIFQDCHDSESIQQEIDSVAKLMEPQVKAKGRLQFRYDVELRKKQMVQLERLSKNMAFNACLKSITEMLNIGEDSEYLIAFAKLVRMLIIITFHSQVRIVVFPKASLSVPIKRLSC